jgi:hypothetical protein
MDPVRGPASNGVDANKIKTKIDRINEIYKIKAFDRILLIL